ncbi:ADP-ribosylglycohydrolase family protein [Siphonobacter sp. SORGH_AS_1065]|uniref:ADP-ribosylglycohydrolase family protein n=1 Tax=Siphonobacter sp. SORGH_AS_1065 TaxID=3041795 RepID=UPI002780100F|nr:ADP-ribosylglycohydrolase family protein [Siphonobacter sp. SORGH_AS_1065]MDQ1086415.1 ADP-ribosylglycohydrolase [Siphonobacter sp. SORGH_AS_1065]
MNAPATKATWKNFPMDHPKRIDIHLLFTDRQFSTLVAGLIPQQMEDKWFIYYENEWLYFHRSWTGHGIYKAKINKVTDGYSIKEFWAERNPKKYKNQDDTTDLETFSFLIARGILGINVRNIYPGRTTKSETDALIDWSTFGNMLFTNQGVDYFYEITSALFGVATGDALGVPVEFNNRESISKNPVTDMIGYGTYNLPAGTWSDDSSLTFCLTEALTQDFDLHVIGQNFVKWYQENYWTPHGNVFDIGMATQQAISRLAQGEEPELAGGFEESDNGNGSLMRILPLLFYLLDKPIKERYAITKQVSSLTHGHIRSVIACFYYLEFAKQILEGKDKIEVYRNLQIEIPNYLTSIAINPKEIALFDRLLKGNIDKIEEEKILSDGYVLHTLEASIWCVLTTNSYEEAVLRAVNLGEDTDTTGAVTGGLAGLLYGFNKIPLHWLRQLARYDDIENLAKRFNNKITSR